MPRWFYVAALVVCVLQGVLVGVSIYGLLGGFDAPAAPQFVPPCFR